MIELSTYFLISLNNIFYSIHCHQLIPILLEFSRTRPKTGLIIFWILFSVSREYNNKSVSIGSELKQFSLRDSYLLFSMFRQFDIEFRYLSTVKRSPSELEDNGEPGNTSRMARRFETTVNAKDLRVLGNCRLYLMNNLTISLTTKRTKGLA